MGLLSLAITNLWKVDLRFKYLMVNQNKFCFKDPSWKLNNTTTRHVFIHLKKIYHQCKYPVNVNSKLFNAKPLLVELDFTREIGVRMNIFYVRLNKTKFNTAEILYKKPFLWTAIFMLIFSTCRIHKQTFISATDCKSTQLFFWFYWTKR